MIRPWTCGQSTRFTFSSTDRAAGCGYRRRSRTPYCGTTVPLANPEQSENMGLAHFPQPPPIDVRSAARAGWRPLVFVPGTRRSSVRKPGPPPSDRGPPALSQEAPEADRSGPYSVGLAMRRLERLAICFGDRQAGNGHRLAWQRLSPFLDMKDPTRPRRTASSSKRGPRSDPQDESRESALGCSPHSRRTAQTGH